MRFRWPCNGAPSQAHEGTAKKWIFCQQARQKASAEPTLYRNSNNEGKRRSLSARKRMRLVAGNRKIDHKGEVDTQDDEILLELDHFLRFTGQHNFMVDAESDHRLQQFIT